MSYRISQAKYFSSFFTFLRFSLILAAGYLAMVGGISANQTATDGYSLQVATKSSLLNKNGSAGIDPWTVVSPAPIGVSRTSGAFVNGRFYIIGGESLGGERAGIVQIYDPQTDVWDTTSADAMPIPVSNLCAAVVGGMIYVANGYSGIAAVTELQIFNPATGTWTTAAGDPFPAPFFGSACAELDGKLFLFGGTPGGGAGIFSDGAWVYDPQQSSGNRWSALSSAPFSHSYGAAVAAGNGLIFLSGVYNVSPDLDTVAAYDPVTDTWIAYPALQAARGGAAVWVRGNRLYVGGGGWNSYLSSVESYDLSQGVSGSWEFTEPLNIGRRTLAYATSPITGQMFAAAGWAGAFLDSVETVAGRNVQLSVIPTLNPLALLLLMLSLLTLAGFSLRNRKFGKA